MVSFINVENAAFIVILVSKNLFLCFYWSYVFNLKMGVSKVFEFTSYSQVMRPLTLLSFIITVFLDCTLIYYDHCTLLTILLFATLSTFCNFYTSFFPVLHQTESCC